MCNGRCAVGRMMTRVHTPFGLREVPAGPIFERQQFVVAATDDRDGGAAWNLARNNVAQPENQPPVSNPFNTAHESRDVDGARQVLFGRLLQCRIPLRVAHGGGSALGHRGDLLVDPLDGHQCASRRRSQLTLARREVLHTPFEHGDGLGLQCAWPGEPLRFPSQVPDAGLHIRYPIIQPRRLTLDGRLFVRKLAQPPIEQPSGGCRAVPLRDKHEVRGHRVGIIGKQLDHCAGHTLPDVFQHIDRVDLPFDTDDRESRIVELPLRVSGGGGMLHDGGLARMVRVAPEQHGQTDTGVRRVRDDGNEPPLRRQHPLDLAEHRSMTGPCAQCSPGPRWPVASRVGNRVSRAVPSSRTRPAPRRRGPSDAATRRRSALSADYPDRCMPEVPNRARHGVGRDDHNT